MTPAEIKSVRKALGLTQAEWAAMLRLSPDSGARTVRKWETVDGAVTGPASLAIEAIALFGPPADWPGA